MVDHDILLNVLRTKLNVTGMALKLMDSYLRPRYCKVAVNGHFLSNRDLVFSVPQGLCAGPVLYTAYSPTMSEVVPKQISIQGMLMTMALRSHIDPFSMRRKKQSNNLKCVWWKSRNGWAQTDYI